MKTILVLLFAAFFTLPAAAQELQQLNAQQAPTPKDTCYQNKIIYGRWSRTKGAMLYINGILIDPSEIEKLKNARKFKNEKWRGKKIKVKGDLCIHYCSPYEQCLSDGIMRFLNNVQYLKRTCKAE
ncbi:hypothetical protein C7N43_34200 [Sphingobacteriales bacterium UPWRP_1]|nr:hypothetical protein BVG80_14330 [Sphingobacteriales bacterium TSM_CSM]PSJ72445.1 hypothetical protein C7N43_34200 [Sphingobacteriales bacterium UPWRP_1]